jgi:hypothetical protein
MECFVDITNQDFFLFVRRDFFAPPRTSLFRGRGSRETRSEIYHFGNTSVTNARTHPPRSPFVARAPGAALCRAAGVGGTRAQLVLRRRRLRLPPRRTCVLSGSARCEFIYCCGVGVTPACCVCRRRGGNCDFIK